MINGKTNYLRLSTFDWYSYPQWGHVTMTTIFVIAFAVRSYNHYTLIKKI